MAKKKNSQKKHTFKHAPAHEMATSAASASVDAGATPASKSPLRTAPASTGRDFSYVAGDMKRIGIAAVLLVALELVLYYVLTHTSAGDVIYNLVKV